MKAVVVIDRLKSDVQESELVSRLTSMIGVEAVSIDLPKQTVTLQYDTPANLNTLEKEIYDAGFPVLNAYKGEE
ncbi:heavy metal-associated domain-containing protein [Staphylococcus sp. 17KM0847]|uniref:putative copper chaperone CsoZ n=1 Tax=Staphylococcus sp. 17KM0847 TaxID=2583989 RepID=UPI0015DC245F|nr:heavy metal-associated domain-containing protein [Staphylococcus sp. 17KM0847]QLK86495.1 heavy-metal-associated domain-containing protein [Staphylococcus sp. 17KM0847]